MALPSGPRSPRPVQTLRWIFEPTEFLHECRARYGEAFTLTLNGVGRFTLFTSPAAIKQIFTTDAVTLHAGEANAFLGPLVGTHSVLLLDEAAHLRQRKLLLPPFHGERMQAYAEIMRDVTDDAVDAWPRGVPFALHEPMQSITLSVILRAVFGMSASSPRFAAMARAVVTLLDHAQSPWVLLPFLQLDFPGSPWRTFTRTRAAADALLYDEIARRRAEPEHERAKRTDILALLLSATHEDGSPMTDQELRDELVTLVVAGHETTASTLAWVFERLFTYPEVYAKAREEVLRVVGDGALEPGQLGKLEYLDAVLKETMRLRPILPLCARKTTRPVEIGGYTIPAGEMVAASIYLAHRREESYPNAEAFAPERWEGVKPDPYAWLPFGGGVRRCIGMAFAQYEAKIVLAEVLLRARLRAAEGGPVKLVRRGITFVPQGGMRAVLEERAPRRGKRERAEAGVAWAAK